MLSRHVLVIVTTFVPCFGVLAGLVAYLCDQVRMPPPDGDEETSHLEEWDLAA